MITENKHNIFERHKVAGVVILYNPESAIICNIQSYLDQIDFLFVIDNSETVNPELIEKLRSFDKIKIIFYQENLGVAKALNIAAALAIQKGFDYLLTMDQDSKVPAGMVKSLLKYASAEEKIGIISPNHSNKYETHLKLSKGIHRVNITMTSGNLLSLNVYQQLGGFCEDYFIDYIDIEYCFRIKKKNYSVLQVNDIILEHNEADLSEKIIYKWVFYPHNHKPFRLYYKTRNLLLLRKEYKNILPELLNIEYDAYFRMLIKIILFESDKIIKLKMVIQGVVDYLKGFKGKKYFINEIK